MTIDQHGLTDQELEHGVTVFWSIVKTILITGASTLTMISFFSL